ncbi:ethylene-dependent gravitropism-deficient andyellow-green-like 3 [Striga asiatica]|uniref:Ethylene-dependent gravitropism-deficient andyellow-green-like 3 n=1 Tax=Striga asiatica TaxID=4170 RepID=A0A5A7PVX4_STRAF|nr:ethylene-dependent gravitropism-deficient andyellow-green-like 3 [Striga asiatica]
MKRTCTVRAAEAPPSDKSGRGGFFSISLKEVISIVSVAVASLQDDVRRNPTTTSSLLPPTNHQNLFSGMNDIQEIHPNLHSPFATFFPLPETAASPFTSDNPSSEDEALGRLSNTFSAPFAFQDRDLFTKILYIQLKIVSTSQMYDSQATNSNERLSSHYLAFIILAIYPLLYRAKHGTDLEPKGGLYAENKDWMRNHHVAAGKSALAFLNLEV